MISNPTPFLTWTKCIWMAVIVATGGFLFYISLETRHAEEKLHRTLAQIEQEKSDIAVLQAEIAYLARPERLEKIAEEKFKNEESYRVAHANSYVDFDDLGTRTDSLEDTLPDNDAETFDLMADAADLNGIETAAANTDNAPQAVTQEAPQNEQNEIVSSFTPPTPSQKPAFAGVIAAVTKAPNTREKTPETGITEPKRHFADLVFDLQKNAP